MDFVKDLLSRLWSFLTQHRWIWWIVAGFIILNLIPTLSRLLSSLLKGDSTAAQKRMFIREGKKYSRKGDLIRAGELFEGGGDLKAAAEHYEKGRSYADAARVLEEMGDNGRAGKLYEMAKEYAKAGDCYSSMNWTEKAKKAYERAGEELLASGNAMLASDLFEKSGAYLKAGKAFERLGNYAKAAELFERASSFYESAQMYEALLKKGRTLNPAELKKYARKSGELYKKAQKHEKAGELFEKAEDFKSSADMYILCKNKKKAASTFFKCREYEKSAEIYERLGMKREAAVTKGYRFLSVTKYKDAAENFEIGGEYRRAAEIFEKIGEFSKAAEAYEKAGDFTHSGNMFVRVKRYKDAGRAYAREEHYELAAKTCEEGRELKEAVKYYEKAGDILKCGDICYRLGDYDLAISYLQRVESKDPDYIDAAGLLAEALNKKGLPQIAVEKYSDVMQKLGVNKRTLPICYNLARIYETMSKYRDAQKIYEKMLLQDFGYKDVKKRVETVKKKVAEKKKVPSVEERTIRKRYDLIGEIGRGGMGIVYKAKDNLLNRIVALKMLPPFLVSDKKLLERFFKEARTAARLNHPNIVTIYDVGQEGERSFIAMEFIEGRSLRQILDAEKMFKPEKVIDVLLQICRGLEHAHNLNVVHRDIKTSNIMLTSDGIVKLADFGLATVVGEATLTDSGSTSGTPLYMSPEQIKGEKLDSRTDIYSFGITMYKMVTGVLPFFEGDIAYQHVYVEPEPPHKLNPEVPEGLENIILKCLQKNKDDRYQSVPDIRKNLERL